MNPKILIVIGIAIVIAIGIVVISASTDANNFENDNVSEQVEESSPRVVQRSLTETVGVSGP